MVRSSSNHHYFPPSATRLQSTTTTSADVSRPVLSEKFARWIKRHGKSTRTGWKTKNCLLGRCFMKWRTKSISDLPRQVPTRLESSRSPLRRHCPRFQEYRVPFELTQRPIELDRLSKAERAEIRKRVAQRKLDLKSALKSGVYDSRRPLDAGRRAWFQEQISSTQMHCLVDPTSFRDGECNIFGHVCPVFFAAEAISETSTARRRGRYIPFAIKVRVVRRDNYTCQHCGTHLRDNEVEFDHKIPISRGGSSEEYNVRLTCFDCNRDKKDRVEI